MRQMMEGVVLHGTGVRARLDGYSSAGKTGSAQIYDYAARHYTHNYNASFMGLAPVTNPAVVVVVTLNGTNGGTAGQGGRVAAPVFRTVAMEALRVLDVPKDLPDEEPKEIRKDKIDSDLAIAGLSDPPPLEEEEPPAPAVFGPVPPARGGETESGRNNRSTRSELPGQDSSSGGRRSSAMGLPVSLRRPRRGADANSPAGSGLAARPPYSSSVRN